MLICLLNRNHIYTAHRVKVSPKGPAILTSGLVQTLWRSFLTSTVVAVLEPSSKSVLPVAWITGPAMDPRLSVPL